ncbi:MAG: YybH family protein [Ilumatobacteraceae bacterium]
MDMVAFAESWVAAWNARDLETVLTHYADDVEFVSPTAAVVVPESRGVISGVDALRDYWTAALPRNPALHFELVDVLATISGLTIVYHNDRHQLVAETLLFGDDGLVHRGIAAYLQPG